MQTWAFPARIERHADDDYVVTFPDIAEAMTGGSSEREALSLAADALEEAVLAYLAAGRSVPQPREAQAGELLIPLDPTTAARAVLAQIMRDQKVSNVALALKLAKSEGAVRRLTDGATGVKIETVLQALVALGQRAALSLV